MSNEKVAVTETANVETPAGESPVTQMYHQTAQAIVEQLRKMRETIPHFAVPTRKSTRRALAATASLPAEFVELTAVARTNHPGLVRGGAPTPAETRDLLSYGDAFRPVADELDALSQFVLFSIAAAKHKAGEEAMTTYTLARRLARSEEHGALAPHVADMRRALGLRGKRSKAARLAREEKRKAAAAAAAAAPSETR